MKSIHAIALVAAVLAVPASAGARTTAPIGLPDCLGKAQVKPAEVVLTCADANFAARRLHWIGWGGTQAAAVGVAVVNNCVPNCVSGKFHNYRIVLIVSGHQSCPTGGSAYLRVTYAFIGRSPFPATSDPVQTFRCR